MNLKNNYENHNLRYLQNLLSNKSEEEHISVYFDTLVLLFIIFVIVFCLILLTKIIYKKQNEYIDKNIDNAK